MPEPDTADEFRLPPLRARSLAELREQHLTLLTHWSGKSDDAVKLLYAAQLRTAAAALGARLEDESERITAQGIIDYWKAALERLPGRNIADPVALAPFDEADAIRLAGRAEEIVAAQSGNGADVAQKILRRLLQIDQATGTFIESPPVPRSALVAIADGDDAAVTALVDALAQADVLRVRTDPEMGETAVEVASRAVARRWQLVESLLPERQRINRIRTTARLWKESGEATGYLLSGKSLQLGTMFLSEAPADSLLHEYLMASIDKAKRDRRKDWGLWLTGAVAAIAIAVIVYLQVADAWRDYKAASRTRTGAVELKGLEESELTQVAPPATNATELSGYVWIGSTAEPLLRDRLGQRAIAPNEITPYEIYRVPANASMNLRSGAPSGPDSLPAGLGAVAPMDGLIEALARPERVQRLSGEQYWLQVRIIPRVRFYYAPEAEPEAIRMVNALTRQGYDVRPRREAHAEPNIIRYYYEDDRPILYTVSRILDDIRTPAGTEAAFCQIVSPPTDSPLLNLRTMGNVWLSAPAGRGGDTATPRAKCPER